MQNPTLIDFLARRFPASTRTTLRQMLKSGRVRVNGSRALDAKRTIEPRDNVQVIDRPREVAPDTSRQQHSLAIVYEDADVLVVNKPAGLLTSTVPREPRPTLLAQVRDYLKASDPKARLGLIHRLDRDATGLLIFSKNDAAYTSLKHQFYHHSVTREYLAVVHGAPNPPAGRIENRLTEHPDGTVHATRNIKAQRAVTDYQTIARRGKRSVLKVTLHTGRKHQIRAHLSGRGVPIVGDTVYGPESAEAHILLAAVRLTIEHPQTGKQMTFEIQPPAYFDRDLRPGE
ncbi:MAG TPA: RluA family pseudouridine synthase [Humisphaera sp.]|nr:RluA family pseudouridine synthase [Humisphaera sp.]